MQRVALLPFCDLTPQLPIVTSTAQRANPGPFSSPVTGSPSSDVCSLLGGLWEALQGQPTELTDSHFRTGPPHCSTAKLSCAGQRQHWMPVTLSCC